MKWGNKREVCIVYDIKMDVSVRNAIEKQDSDGDLESTTGTVEDKDWYRVQS